MKDRQIKEILHNAGLRHTPGRVALIRLLADAAVPLTQDEISRQLTGSGLNRVTIYRALASFQEAGLVHRVDSGDRIWKFAFCGCGRRGHCHPHFICRGCGKIECLPEVKLPELPQLKAGYLVESNELYLRGLCSVCS